MYRSRNQYPDAPVGWVWGWPGARGRETEWLSVPGSASIAPELAASAPEAAPPPPELAGHLALARVAEVRHPGVTGGRGMAYWVIDHPPVEVAALTLALAALTERQVAELAEAYAATGPEWDVAANAGWSTAIGAGDSRRLDWYRCRLAVERWEPAGHPALGYRLGYLAAAVACRDLLTAEQYTAFTAPARPHLTVPDHTAPAATRTAPAP